MWLLFVKMHLVLTLTNTYSDSVNTDNSPVGKGVCGGGNDGTYFYQMKFLS